MKAFEMLILKPKWSWIWTRTSLSVLLGCFQWTLTLFTPHQPRTIQDASSPHNSRNHTCKNKWLPTLKYNLFRPIHTCRTNAKALHTLKASADEMKPFTLTRSCPKQMHKGFKLYRWWICAEILLLCFQTVGQNKDLDCSIFTDLFYLNYITAL